MLIHFHLLISLLEIYNLWYPGVVARAFIPRNREAEAGGCVPVNSRSACSTKGVSKQPRLLHREPILKKKNKTPPPKIMEIYDNLDSGIFRLPRSFYFFLFHVYEYLPP